MKSKAAIQAPAQFAPKTVLTSSRKIGQLPPFSEFKIELRTALRETLEPKVDLNSAQIHHLLNGGATKALHKNVALAVRSEYGMFFSGERLGATVAKLISPKILEGAVLADPACGAGDLLLACLAIMPIGETLSSTLRMWSRRVSGLDIHHELALMARQRIMLLAAFRHRSNGISKTIALPNSRRYLNGLRGGDYLSHTNSSTKADCIVMNPPFTEMDTPNGCTWSSGKVQAAAVFVMAALNTGKDGQEIVAVLPDVLRSGSRYERWRQLVSASSDLLSLKIFGLFDSTTDVDVFILHLRKRKKSKQANKIAWNTWARSLEKNVVSDLFDVSVGAVVPHRHKTGLWMPFVDVSVSPADGDISILKNCRFEGAMHKGPFVVVRRTSSPSDGRRAVGSIYRHGRYVAVENHLIVLQPLDGSVASCKKLMTSLQSKSSDAWLNKRIRCRHLTTGAMAHLPLFDWR